MKSPVSNEPRLSSPLLVFHRIGPLQAGHKPLTDSQAEDQRDDREEGSHSPEPAGAEEVAYYPQYDSHERGRRCAEY